MPTDTLRDIIATYSELLRVHQLNIELLNTLEESLFYVQHFCKNHNIPFHDEQLCSILTKVENLLNEINSGISPNTLCETTDDFLQRKRTDKDFTEPEVAVRVDPL
jgi:hypothetical protein